MRVGHRIPAVFCGVVAVFLVMGATPAAAQRRAAADQLDVAATQTALRGGNLDEARGALEMLGISGSPRAIPVLQDYIRSGPPSQLIETAVEAVGAVGGPQSAPILVELMTHRRPGVRLRAAEAAASIRSREVAGALRVCLDDSDATVRAGAARALARAGSQEDVATLFRALEKGVLEASASIGTLGNAADAERFAGLLGRLPFDKMVPGLDAFLNRRDLGVPPRVMLVRKLQELATVEIKSFLQAFLDSMPPRERGPLRDATQEAIARIAD